MSSQADPSEKQEIRGRILALRQSLSPDNVREAGRRITEMILGDPVAEKSSVICTYANMGKEVPTRELMGLFLENGKTVAVPDWEGWKQGSGIRLGAVRGESDLLTENRLVPQPVITTSNMVPVEDVELFLVPGIAFDHCGNRLGMGGGFFDRLLALASSRATFFGLAYGFQLLDRLPLEPHDVPVHRVFSS